AFGENYHYWDFCDSEIQDPGGRDCKRVSYSIQAPLYDPAAVACTPGFTANSRGGLAIMADKTPEFDGKTAATNWEADPITEDNRKDGMSQNHNSGDFINVLFSDAHVSGGKRADAGLNDDNIYSASNDDDGGTQGAGSTSLLEHLSGEDSFLIGPVKN
ncbi:MAG: hypothetical protein KAV00_01030, partial [Phycisphaerae bacterium]|nr:hypothetical protein [Phycisphaerae bacterium]